MKRNGIGLAVLLSLIGTVSLTGCSSGSGGSSSDSLMEYGALCVTATMWASIVPADSSIVKTIPDPAAPDVVLYTYTDYLWAGEDFPNDKVNGTMIQDESDPENIATTIAFTVTGSFGINTIDLDQVWHTNGTPDDTSDDTYTGTYKVNDHEESAAYFQNLLKD